MIKPLQRQSPLAYGAKILFLFARPLSTKVSCPTHWFINEAALELLAAAGYGSEVNFLLPYRSELQEGVAWADSGYKNIGHFFNPTTKKGIYGFASAAVHFIHYLNKSVRYGQAGNLADAAFYLGAAAHLLQDLCVPHHTCGYLFEGHKEYEAWVENNYADYLIFTDSLEKYFKKPFSLLLTNATVSLNAIDLVTLSSTTSYRQATTQLLPLAEYSTAGLLYWFCRKLKIQPELSLLTPIDSSFLRV